MDQKTLVFLINQDIEELKQLTEGFSQMDNYPTILLSLAIDKAQHIVNNLDMLKHTKGLPTPAVAPVVHEAREVPQPAVDDEDEADAPASPTERFGEGGREAGEWPSTFDVQEEPAAEEPGESEEFPAEAETPEQPAEPAYNLNMLRDETPETQPAAWPSTFDVQEEPEAEADETPAEQPAAWPSTFDVQEEPEAEEDEAFPEEPDMPEAETEAAEEQVEAEFSVSEYEEHVAEPFRAEEAVDTPVEAETPAAEAFDASSEDKAEEPEVEVEIPDLEVPAQPAPATEPTSQQAAAKEESHTLFDLFATQQTETRNDTLQHQHIDDIRRAINIGDSFRFQRELFQGNGELMIRTISVLNNCRNFDEAQDYVKRKFNWKEDSETAQHFMQIVSRRFI